MRKYKKDRKKHTDLNCQCASCKSKRGEYSGQNHPMFGVSPSNKSIEALIKYNREIRKGSHLSKEHKKNISLAMQGRCPAPITIQKAREAKRQGKGIGKNHPNYIDGRTPLYNRIKNLVEYKTWRNDVFKRDDYTCVECGDNRGHNLNSHHKKEFHVLLAEFLKEYDQFSPIEDKETLIRLAIKWQSFWDIDNGKTLCEDCHIQKYHKK